MSTDPNALIELSIDLLHPHYSGDRLVGDVASTLVTTNGNTYSGVCIDLGSGVGFCAEHSAMAAMVTAREYKIASIVAVWKDENGIPFVLPPCGRCREFMKQLDVDNLDTDVVLAPDNIVKLRDLLPYNEWPAPLR